MPSRRVIAAFIISISLVAAIIIVKEPRKISEKIESTSFGSLTSGPDIKAIRNDSWQEETQDISKGVTKTQTSSTTETFTDEFSRSLMANYLALKKSGDTDPNSTQELITKASEFIDNTNISQYNIKDITVSPDNSKAALTKYGNDLGLAVKINEPAGEAENEILLITEMMTDMDASIAPKLKNISAIYRNTAASLAKVIVPSTMLSSHLKMVNGLQGLSNGVSDMSSGVTDTFLGIRGLQTYTTSHTMVEESRSEIMTGILKSGANYKQGENGYYFFFGI
jgi:hypothetical protein